MIKVYFVVKPISAEGLWRTAERLPEWENIREIQNENVRNDTVLGRLILRYALFSDYGIDLMNTVILKDENGKPYLRDRRNIYFSISHTNTCVACAVGDVPVGLDTEAVTDKDRRRITDRMFTEKERGYAGTDPMRFCEIWTKKESFVKLTGEGLSRRFADFCVIDGVGTDGAVFTPLYIPDTAVCICTAEADTVVMTELTPEDLENIK